MRTKTRMHIRRHILKFRRIISLFLSVVLIQTLLPGCSAGKQPAGSKYSKFLTVDVFDVPANVPGIQSGWFAHIVKERFNMELNIINANSETVYESRFASGNLGDLIITSSANGRLQDMVDAGLVLDMTPYMDEDSQLVRRYSSQIGSLNNTLLQTGIYAIPSQLSSSDDPVLTESTQPIFGAYIRWDYYNELGCPAINTLEDLLPVLLQMQELHPTSESGEPTYGFSLFSSWDDNMMNAIKQPCCIYGYDEHGFVLAKADGSDFQNILDKDSLYYRSLRFYNTAYRMGLVDPVSRFQDYNNVAAKFSDGQILFSPWPWLAQPAFNTTEHTSEGKGYMFVPIGDELVYSSGNSIYGNFSTVIAVGADAKDPERMVDFITWLYSDEGILCCKANSQLGTAGPEGLTWEMTDDGPVLTDFGRRALYGEPLNVPDSYGGGLWNDGISALNFTPVATSEKSDRGFPYFFAQWDSVIYSTQSDFEKSWTDKYDALNPIDYLKKHDRLIISIGTDYSAPKESAELKTIRSQCAKVIVDYSWDMVFAEDDETFDALYEELIAKTNALDYAQILEYDMTSAKNEAELKKEVLNKND